MLKSKFNFGDKRVLMVGDRPNTDIAFGNASKIDTCLVMTGVVKD
jgi:ribonucleotide monophosphatase NagD (HAD superfamily)